MRMCDVIPTCLLVILASLAVGCSTVESKPSAEREAAQTLEPALQGTYEVATPHDLYIATTRHRWRCSLDALDSCELIAFSRSVVSGRDDYRAFFFAGTSVCTDELRTARS